MNNNSVILIVLDANETKRLEYDDVGKHLLSNPEIGIVSRASGAKDPFQNNLRARGLLNHRGVFLRSPYDEDNFQEQSEARLAFALEKYMYFSLFCNHLGAKEVVVEQIENLSRSGRSSYNAMARTPEVKGKVEGKENQIEILKSQLKLHDVFVGGEPQFDKAKALLEQHKLLGDSSMQSLLTIQEAKTNVISSRTLSLDLSRESKRIFNLAGSLGFPEFLSDFQGGLKKTMRQSSDLILRITVKF